jgi:hypothetical protein
VNTPKFRIRCKISQNKNILCKIWMKYILMWFSINFLSKGVLALLFKKKLIETKFLWKKRINRYRYEMCRRNDAMRYKANNQDTFDGQFKLENWKKFFITKMLIRKSYINQNSKFNSSNKTVPSKSSSMSAIQNRKLFVIETY